MAFLTLVEGAIRQVLTGLEQAQAIRPATEAVAGPVHHDLQASP